MSLAFKFGYFIKDKTHILIRGYLGAVFTNFDILQQAWPPPSIWELRLISALKLYLYEKDNNDPLISLADNADQRILKFDQLSGQAWQQLSVMRVSLHACKNYNNRRIIHTILLIK